MVAQPQHFFSRQTVSERQAPLLAYSTQLRMQLQVFFLELLILASQTIIVFFDALVALDCLCQLCHQASQVALGSAGRVH